MFSIDFNLILKTRMKKMFSNNIHKKFQKRHEHGPVFVAFPRGLLHGLRQRRRLPRLVLRLRSNFSFLKYFPKICVFVSGKLILLLCEGDASKCWLRGDDATEERAEGFSSGRVDCAPLSAWEAISSSITNPEVRKPVAPGNEVTKI